MSSGNSGRETRGRGALPDRSQMALARGLRATLNTSSGADEGDPGIANRRVWKATHSIVEGMIIAAYAIGRVRALLPCKYQSP